MEQVKVKVLVIALMPLVKLGLIPLANREIEVGRRLVLTMQTQMETQIPKGNRIGREDSFAEGTIQKMQVRSVGDMIFRTEMKMRRAFVGWFFQICQVGGDAV